MSNSLLNKLKVVDSSRARLKTILEEKNVAPSGNSLPALIEDVNRLYKPGESSDWDGVPMEDMPEYYKTALDFDTIYQNDTDKDNYQAVTMFIICVEDGDLPSLPQNALQSWQKYKFSDDEILRNPARNRESPAHTWNSSNDIIGTDGQHYRWILCYSNETNITFDYQAAFINVDGYIMFKGTCTGLGIRDQYGLPKYVELKSDCIINGGIAKDDTSAINTSLRTFLCNASTAFFNDGLFQNCINLKVFKCTSTYRSNNNNHLFAGCSGMRYCYFKEINNFYENTFNAVKNCFVYVGTAFGTFFGRDNYNTSPFSYSDGIRLRIDTIMGSVRRLATDRDGERIC